MIRVTNYNIMVKCGRECLCKFNIDNNHLKLTGNELIKVMSNLDKKFCFYDYGGCRKEIEIEMKEEVSYLNKKR